jgi:hypothetical protein
MSGVGFAEWVAGVAHEDVAGFTRHVELVAESGAVVRVRVRVQIGVERSRATAERISDLINCGSCADPEMGACLVERHAIAVR